jgi:molybdenum cofactor biosynthesis enzyme MoaA
MNGMRGKVKMETYEKINEDLIRKIIIEDIDLKKIRDEISNLDIAIKSINLMEYLDKSDDEMKEPVDEINYKRQLNKEFLIKDKEKKESKLQELLKI